MTLLAESVGQQGSELLDAGLEIVDHHHRLAVLRADFLAHPLEARGARLQVGDADDVLVGHPQREVARRLRRRASRRRRGRASCAPRRARRSARPGSPCSRSSPSGRISSSPWRASAARGCCGRSARAARRCRSRRRSRAGSPRRRARRRGSPARRPRATSGSTPLPAIAPNSTALITVPLSCASLRMSNSTALLRQLPAGGDHPVAVEAAVGHLHLLDRGVDAVRRGDERGALGADVAVLHRAAGLDQLGGDHDVDVAGAGRQREDRLFSVQSFLS